MDEARFRRRYTALQRMLDRRSRTLGRGIRPGDLRDGCRYVLGGGGKRIRSVVLLLSCEAVGGSARQALDAGVALETLHNFTLVHDDIMDHADSRRGRPSVHRRWDANTALLVGDTLVGLAYQSLFRGNSAPARALARLLTEGLIEVCEGQALDMAYARRSRISVRQYFAMIDKKTARLLSIAAELGAAIGGGTPAQGVVLRAFGRHLGRAFQLQDDLLDVVADEAALGKPVGGDIMEGKKTFLLLTASVLARGEDRALLGRVLRGTVPGREQRTLIPAVTAIYRRYGVLERAVAQIRRETRSAVRMLDRLPQTEASAMLAWLAEALSNRVS